jgi:hypothetical protein
MIPSNLDQYQMDNMTFDVEKQAWRVSVVDGVTLNVDKINLPEQKVTNIPVIIKETDVKQVNVPVVIKEVEKIEVPVIVKEYVTIEKPVIVTEVKVIEIEKPVIIKETEIKTVEKLVPVTPTLVKVCIALQTIACIGILLNNILKG